MATAVKEQPPAVESAELLQLSCLAASRERSGSRRDNAAHSPRRPAAPESDAQPTTAAALDRKTLLKVVSAGFSFLVAGCNDGSIGALLPYMITDYKINTAVVSCIYAASFAGWFTAALANTHLSQYLELGAMLALGALCQIAAQALRSWGPPFGLFVATFWLVCVGQAFQDTYGNTFVAGVRGAHRWLGFIHAMYMLGCLIGPFVSTAVASAGPSSRWYYYYLFPMGLGIANLAFVLLAFRDTVRLKLGPGRGERPHSTSASTSGSNQGGGSSRSREAMALIRAALKTPSVWVLSLFYFFYIGVALTSSGWVVEYLVQVRHGDLSHVGYVPAGFNGGCLISRLLLAEPTHRFGEKRMILLYCVFACAFQVVFWLVPTILAASIAVSFVGFFVGPFFATGMSLGSKLFPSHVQPTALALVFVCAQMGGSLFPILTGVIASHAGVKVLQPILISLLLATGVTWALVPKPKASNHSDRHQE